MLAVAVCLCFCVCCVDVCDLHRCIYVGAAECHRHHLRYRVIFAQMSMIEMMVQMEKDEQS